MAAKESLILPNFICIGAQKTGTTTLYHILKNHPEITVSKPRKETKFFYRDEEYQFGLPFYSKYFSYSKPRKAIGEFDPDYLYFPYVAERIYKTLGNKIKFIVILRNPVDRAYSHYLMSVKKGFEKLSFHEALLNESTRIASGLREEKNNFSYLNRGLYDEQLNRYFKYFPKENFLFINYEEEFNKDLTGTLKKIYEFLDINYAELNTNIKENIATNVKSEKLRDLMRRNKFLKEMASLIISNKEIRKSIKLKISGWNSTTSKKKTLDHNFRQELIDNYFLKSINNLKSIVNIDLTSWIKN